MAPEAADGLPARPRLPRHPVRQSLFRAGHAHAGIWIILAFGALLCVDQTELSDGPKWLVRVTVTLAPILAPLDFFARSRRRRPSGRVGLIHLVYLGGASLAVGAGTLGVDLLLA